MELTRGDTGQYRFQRKDADGEVILTRTEQSVFGQITKT